MPDKKPVAAADIEAMEVDVAVEEEEDEEEELPPKVIPIFLKDEEDKLPLLTSYKYNMFVHDNILDFSHRAFIFKARKVFEAKLEKLCRLRTKDEIKRKKRGLKKDMEKEEDRKKELFDIYVQLGHIHLLAADFPKSMFAYQHAYKYDTAKFRSNPPALFGLGLVYFHFKAHAACIEAFNHYLYCETGGEVAKEVHVRLGIVHKICGDFEKSRRHFCCALDDLRKTPLFTESEIQFHIAHCYDAAGDSKAAFEEYTKLKNDPLVQQDKRLLANVYRALGWVSFRSEPQTPEKRIQSLKEVEIYLKEAQKLDDQNSRSFYYLGRFYSELPNQANIAFINYRASIDKNEHDADTWCSIGVLYKIQSQDLDALQAFVCAVQINPTHSAAWTNLGKLYEHHCFYRDANYCYKKAVTNNSPNPEPLKRRIQVLEKAIKENPHLFLKPLPLNYKSSQNSLHPLEQAWCLGIPAELLPHQKEIAKYHRYLYRLGSPFTKMSELAGAYSNRQPLGELNPTQMEILKILQINKDHLESNERSLLQHLEQRFRQTDKRHGQQHQQLQAAETTVSNEVANSNLSKDLLEDPTMKPFPFLPSNDLDNLMAQALKDDPSTSNMGNYLEGNDGTVVAAENRSTPPIKSGELPTNFSLLSNLHVPITITANEVLSRCQQRLTNPEAFAPIFDESCPPPRPDVIPLKQRPAMDKLGLKTPLIKVEKPSEAHSLELQNFCYKSPIALIRGLTTALKMDLSLFSTKSMTETQPDYSVEVRTQYRMPGDINVDQLGQPSWTCYSTRSYTNIGRYGAYQAESFRHSLKEETERLRAAGTGSKYAIAAAKAQAEGTPLGTIATTAPVASLLSLSNTATNTRESSSTPTPTSSTAPPPAKRRRTGGAGNQASVNASAAKLAAVANLCGPDDLPTGHMPMKVVKFGTNVDLSDETKFPLQLKELNKMPAFTRNAAGACNLLSHLGHSVFGMNTVQMYMKVPGCRTPGHLENNCFASVNINIGPGECEWFGVDYEYWPVVNKMCNDRKMDLMKDSWWPNFEDLIKARVPVYRFTQKAGDLVWVGGGCVHWVQAIGWCNNVAWNVGPMTAEQLEMSLYAYEWNKLTNYRSLVPMQHLCWQLAVNVRFTNQKFFNVVKGVLIRSLSFCRMIYDYIETRTKNPIKYQPRIKGEASHYCHNCDIEVFNMLFVKEHHNKFRVFCVHCAKKTEFEEYVVLQQTSFDELSNIFDRLQLHPMTTKDDCLFLKNKDQSFVNSSYQQPQQYSNLNLNELSSNISTIHSNISNSNDDKNLCQKFDLKTIPYMDDGDEDASTKKATPLTTDNSTLSLHITAYENSIGPVDSEIKTEEISLAKPWKIATSNCIEKLYEFPRQQKEGDITDPEVMQFKTSQKLLNPNQPGSGDNRRSQGQSSVMSTTAMDESSSQNDEVKVKLAELERENYVLKEQLNESKLSVDRINKENEALKGANQTLEKQALEKSNNYLHIDKERETLLVDKARYQSENTQLKHQKELLEAQTTRLLSEKRSLTEDIQTVKDDYQKALQRIAKLQTDIDDFQSEKALLAHDKERWAQEKELYGKNREWYMNELADRDKTISSLRLQIVQLERDLTIKNAELGNTVDEYTLKTESLTAKLEEQEEECRVLREKNTELKNENRIAVDNISAELQVKERLIQTYKDEVESLKAELENYKNDETALREALDEKDAALVAVNDENRKIADEASQSVADRELRIIQLQDELDKANELLKFGTSGLPGSDISAFSASAAELLSSGTSLSSIYAQHSKVLAELAEEKQKQKDLEEYVRTILNDLKKNAPNVLQIRKENDTLHVENDELRRQLKNAFDERDHLRNEAGNAGRELKFTRTELLSAQHENSTLKKQVQKLLFVAEQSTDHVNPDVSDNDVVVFSNIRELHERNIELIQQLDELKRSNEESVKQARQEEIENLHLKLQEFSHEIEMLRDSQEKTAFIINQLEKQRDGYKEELEHRQRSPLKSLNSSRTLVETDTNSEWKIKYEKMEEQLRYIVNDKQKTEEALNERVNSQMELISQLRITNGRIESDLEYQKKNQETAFKKVNEFEKDIAKKNEQIAKHKAQLENDQQQIQKLTNELFIKQDELTKLNVNLRLLNDKYDVARNNAVSYEAQVKVLRENRYSAERTNLTLEGIENLLKIKEKEKIEQMKSQLDVLTIERDNYRNAVEDLRSHSERRNMELQATLSEAVAAKDKLQIELKYHREQYSSLEQLLEKTQAENAELLKKFEELKSADLSVDGLNKEIQQLRNKNLYHEKQLTEQRAQLDQMKAKLEAKEKELEELQRLTGGFENTMKSQDELQHQQQNRLQEECKQLTNDLEAARKTIEELNAKVFDAETRESNHSHTMDTLRHEYQVQIAELQKSLTSVQSQVEGKTKEITELLNSLQNAQSDRDNVDSRVKLLDDQLVAAEKQIAELKADLRTSHERFEIASNEHDSMVSRLRNSVVLLEKEKARLNEELSELQTRDHEQKLNMDTLYDKIQSLTQDSLLNSQLDTSATGLNTSQSGGDNNSLTAVVDILRKIKDKEMEMRMAAEIELSRIKAQAHIDEQHINQLSSQVEELNKQVQINGQLMNEKNELVNRLGSLQSVQRRNEALQHELNLSRDRISALEQQIQRLNFELEKVSRAKEAAESQYSAAAQELAQVKKDLAQIRQRCSEAEKQIAQGVASPADAQKVAELENEKNSLAKKLADTTENMQKIKSLARKYRDEHSACAGNIAQLQAQITKLEAEKKQIQEEALPAGLPYGIKTAVKAKQTEITNLKAEITTLNEKINTLTTTNEEMKRQLEEAQTKASASSELDFRVKSLTNAFNAIKNRTTEQDVELKQLKAERDQYLAEVETLKAEIATLSAMPSESSANLISESSTVDEPPSSSAVPPARKRTIQEVVESDFGVPSAEATAKRSRQEDSQEAAEEISNDLVVDMGEQSNDAQDRVPSVEQRDDEQMDEDIVPEDDGNLDFGDQDYYGVQDTESFPEPPNLAHEEENNDEEEQYDYAGLPNYPQDQDDEEGGDDTMGEGEGEEEYDEAEDIDDDDDDADIHSEEPDEGEEFNEGNQDQDDSDDDVVVLS